MANVVTAYALAPIRSLNDQVEGIHCSLYEDKEYRAFLYAVYKEQTIEGSFAADNAMAAGIIRNRAREIGNIEVSRQKLATIVKALNVVLRRHGLDRKTRRNTVCDVVVPE
jgi:hypothetical protein